jgi:hypothetical protein
MQMPEITPQLAQFVLVRLFETSRNYGPSTLTTWEAISREALQYKQMRTPLPEETVEALRGMTVEEIALLACQ